jgi:hypothetical protein
MARCISVIALVLCFATVFESYAFSSTESLIRDTIQKVETGSRLVARARQRVNQGASLQDLEVALELYVEAGQLFEQAGKIMKALGPQYISMEDLEGCGQALQSCIIAIEELKRQIRKIKKYD